MDYNFSIDSRYLNGKIYKVFSKNFPNLMYIGSTIKTLSERFSQHRYNPTNEIMKKFFQHFDDIVIELVELFPCFNKAQLAYREQLYMNAQVTQFGMSLNNNRACILKGNLYPKFLVEWLLIQHPEHAVLLTYIIIRDYPTL